MTQEQALVYVLQSVSDGVSFMLPIIAVFSAISFILSWVFYLSMGFGRRQFRD